jgi:hypothetical protein
MTDSIESRAEAAYKQSLIDEKNKLVAKDEAKIKYLLSWLREKEIVKEGDIVSIFNHRVNNFHNYSSYTGMSAQIDKFIFMLYGELSDANICLLRRMKEYSTHISLYEVDNGLADIAEAIKPNKYFELFIPIEREDKRWKEDYRENIRYFKICKYWNEEIDKEGNSL